MIILIYMMNEKNECKKIEVKDIVLTKLKLQTTNDFIRLIMMNQTN